jgi:hypothetical protein
MTSIEKLQEIISTMDVPSERKNDIGWLNRNILIRNMNHPDIPIVMFLIKNILRKGDQLN